MAGIGDYIKKGKGSRGFKMEGFSYPGESPLKGKKKKAQQAAAAEDLASAQEKSAEFEDMEMKSTDLFGEESFKVDQTSPVKNIDWGKIGEEALKSGAEAVVTEGVKAGVGALTKKKEKPGREGPDVSGFSGIGFGKK